jgi:ubiquinone biosynthesis protein COQ4
MKRPHEKRHPLKALRALKKLMDDNTDTLQVFEVLACLVGGGNRKNYARLLETIEGGKIAYEQVDLAALQADPAWRNSFAPGTLGAAYAAFVDQEGVDTSTLTPLMLNATGGELSVLPHPLAWNVRRNVSLHDVWHVLTGYGRDSIGESALVGFSYWHTDSLGFLAISLGGSLILRGGFLAIMEGIINGYRAKLLIEHDYVELFAMPLKDVRSMLNIRDPIYYKA